MLTMGDECLDLPPGFRFHPTDEEIVTCYLTEKVKNKSFSARAIGEVDLNKSEPWDLPSKFLYLFFPCLNFQFHVLRFQWLGFSLIFVFFYLNGGF